MDRTCSRALPWPREFLDGMTFQQYRLDRKTRSAVERQLQIMTEAAFRLGERGPQLCPQIDWQGIRGLGNFLRHEYDRVSDEVIWDVLQERLPELEAALRTALIRLETKL